MESDILLCMIKYVDAIIKLAGLDGEKRTVAHFTYMI